MKKIRILLALVITSVSLAAPNAATEAPQSAPGSSGPIIICGTC